MSKNIVIKLSRGEKMLKKLVLVTVLAISVVGLTGCGDDDVGDVSLSLIHI